jgi:hypothetical protein
VQELKTLEQARLAPRLHRRLRGLGAAIRLRLLVCGLGWSLVALLAAAAVSFVIDVGLYRITLQHMTLLQRALVNLVCLAGVLIVARRRLLRPLAKAFGEDDLALVIEHHHPELQDRLISALQFERRPPASSGEASPELVAVVVDQANRAASGLRFGSVLRNLPARRAAGYALFALLAASAFTYLLADYVGPWAVRNLMLRDVRYPQRTHLSVAGGNPLRVVRGGRLDIVVTADPDKVVPPAVVFHMRFPSLGELTEAVKPRDGKHNVYVKPFPVVAEPFTFRVTGNDDRTREIRVELVEPPAFSRVELTVEPPAYTRLLPYKVGRGQGSVDVLENATLKLSALGDGSLGEARAYLDDEAIATGGLVETRDADGNPVTSVSAKLLITSPKPFRPRRHLRIAIRDKEGFENPVALSLNINLLKDQPPVVQMETHGIGGQISSRAAVPLRLTSSDDYGVSDVYLEWSIKSNPLNVQTNVVKAYAPDEPSPETLAFMFDLEQIAARSTTNAPALQEGETLRLFALATDSLPPPGGPQRSRSNLISLSIVSDDDVITTCLDAQIAVRESLTELMEFQKDIRDRTEGAVALTTKTTTLGVAYREAGTCRDLEQQARDMLDAALEKLVNLMDRIANNRMMTAEDTRRIRQRIIVPLQESRDRYMDPLIAGFRQTSSINDAGALASHLQDLITQQNDFINLIKSVVDEMIKLEQAQHIERGLKTIIRLSDQVRDIARGKLGTDEEDDEKDKEQPQEPGDDQTETNTQSGAGTSAGAEGEAP